MTALNAWQYYLVLNPAAPDSRIELWAARMDGTRQMYLSSKMPAGVDTPMVQDILQEFYTGLLQLLELTA